MHSSYIVHHYHYLLKQVLEGRQSDKSSRHSRRSPAPAPAPGQEGDPPLDPPLYLQPLTPPPFPRLGHSFCSLPPTTLILPGTHPPHNPHSTTTSSPTTPPYPLNTQTKLPLLLPLLLVPTATGTATAVALSVIVRGWAVEIAVETAA